jgi:hypothetical protein
MDYKDTLLDNLKSLLHDVISEDQITPNEIYDCIQKTVKENYYYHKHHTGRSYELMTKFNDYNPWEEYFSTEDDSKNRTHYQDYINAGYEMTADGFWIKEYKKQKKYWSLPVEMDAASGEYYFCFPDDLLEAANLKEGDIVEWIDQGDGSYRLSKTVLSKKLDGDGFSVTHW